MVAPLNRKHFADPEAGGFGIAISGQKLDALGWSRYKREPGGIHDFRAIGVHTMAYTDPRCPYDRFTIDGPAGARQ